MRFGHSIKGAILDVDGVLLDSLEIWRDLGAKYLASQGIVPEAGLGETLFSMSMEQGAEYLGKTYALDKTPAEIMDGLQGMLRDFYLYEVLPKEGAAELLSALDAAGVRMAAATSSPREHVTAALERNGMLPYVGRIFTNAEVGTSKHSPEIYDAAAEFLGFAKEQVCVFEDSLYALKTAARAGYRTIGVFDKNGEPNQRGLEESAEVYVLNLKELQRLF